MEVLGVPDKDFINRSPRRKLFFDTNGAPRSVINSKGRKRRPGSKTLSQVLRCNDEEFVDFVAKCLVWDPERRMKPQAAMRHPFVTAGRRLKPPSSTTKSTSSLSNLGRNKQVPETPKKSLISAPTPLTARLSRTTTNGGPTTPITQSQPIASGSSHTSRSYRSSQSQSLSNFNSSRTMSGYASSSGKWLHFLFLSISLVGVTLLYIILVSSCHVCPVHLHCFPWYIYLHFRNYQMRNCYCGTLVIGSHEVWFN